MVATRSAYRTTEAVCAHCGGRFKAYRATAKYCGEACKQQAKRERGFATAAKEARELVRAMVTAGADPRGSETDADLQEQLRLARLEADLWERTFHAAMQEMNKGKRP